MSNSARAKERRSKRSKLSKSQRDIYAKQHFGDSTGQWRGQKLKSDSMLVNFLKEVHLR